MLRLIIYLVFIISVATAAGGVTISLKIRNRYPGDIFSALLYYQVFIFTFGFYGIWGQMAINSFFAGKVTPELLSGISEIALLLGFPFLIFSLLMLVKFSAGIAGRTTGNFFVFLYLLFNFSALLTIGYFITRVNEDMPASLLKYYFIITNAANSLISVFFLFKHGGKQVLVHDHDRKNIAAITILLVIVQSVVVVFFKDQTIIAIIFILVFFAGGTFLPVYLRYETNLSAIEAPVEDLTFDEFCRKYEVSPREKDIIREICNGLSNKEISEKLFISLQTVKDHTHRIYIKTNVKSRMQLMKIVKGS